MARALLVFLALGLLVSCGADSVKAENLALEAMELRYFPKHSWRFPNNRFFLWKNQMTPQQVSRARALSSELDRLDSRAVPINRRFLELETKIDPLKDNIRLLTTHQRTLKTAIDKANRAKSSSETYLAMAKKNLAEEEAKPKPDPEIVAQWNAEILKLQTEITGLTNQIFELQTIKDKLDANIAQLRATLLPLQTEKDSVQITQDEIRLSGQNIIDEIMTLVDWYKDQPTSTVFQFEETGGISASISGWNLGDGQGQRNFSTQTLSNRKPTMGNVQYEEDGGVFSFDAYVFTDDTQEQIRDTYHFRIGRIKYDTQDGLNYFSGDLIRTSADGEVRRGIAKLVDRNN